MAASRRTFVNGTFILLMCLKMVIAGAKLPRKILCADTDCRAPISRVQTIFNYQAPDPYYLSFNQHDVIQVFAKDVEEDDLWTGELLMKPGKIGLFNKNLVKELVIFNKSPRQHVDTVDFFEARAPHKVTVTTSQTIPEQSKEHEEDLPKKDNMEKEAEGEGTEDMEEDMSGPGRFKFVAEQLIKQDDDDSKPAPDKFNTSQHVVVSNYSVVIEKGDHSDGLNDQFGGGISTNMVGGSHKGITHQTDKVETAEGVEEHTFVENKLIPDKEISKFQFDTEMVKIPHSDTRETGVPHDNTEYHKDANLEYPYDHQGRNEQYENEQIKINGRLIEKNPELYEFEQETNVKEKNNEVYLRKEQNESENNDKNIPHRHEFAQETNVNQEYDHSHLNREEQYEKKNTEIDKANNKNSLNKHTEFVPKGNVNQEYVQTLHVEDGQRTLSELHITHHAGHFGEDTVNDEDYFDGHEDDDDDGDDDWSYFDRKVVEEDFLEDLLDARGGEDRIIKNQETPKVEKAKITSYGDDLDKGDLEEVEKNHYDGTIENKPSAEKEKIIHQIIELMRESDREEQKRIAQASRNPGGPLRGETMSIYDANVEREMEIMKELHVGAENVNVSQEEKDNFYTNNPTTDDGKLKHKTIDPDSGEEYDKGFDVEDAEELIQKELDVSAIHHDEDQFEDDDMEETIILLDKDSQMRHNEEDLYMQNRHENHVETDKTEEILPLHKETHDDAESSGIWQEEGDSVPDSDEGEAKNAFELDEQETISDQSNSAKEEPSDGDTEEFIAVMVDEDKIVENGDDAQNEAEPENEDEKIEMETGREDTIEVGKDGDEFSHAADAQDQGHKNEEKQKETEEEDMKEKVNDVATAGDEVGVASPEETKVDGTENVGKEQVEEEGLDAKEDDSDQNADDGQGQGAQLNNVQPSPVFEVIDGTTLYPDDLEPTPMPANGATQQLPHQANIVPSESGFNQDMTPSKTQRLHPQGGIVPSGELVSATPSIPGGEASVSVNELPPGMSDNEGKGAVFSMHASDVVKVYREGAAPPPTVFSVKSEEEIDPEAYRNILQKLHATPHLKDNEDAIQQEMLKILRDPELKKNLLVKSHPPPRKTILSPFLHPPPTVANTGHHQQDQQLSDNPTHKEAADNPGDNVEGNVPPPLPVGPGTVESKSAKDVNVDDPLAILKRGESPEQFYLPSGSVPIPPSDVGDPALESMQTVTSDPHHDDSHQESPINSVDRADDPAAVESGQTSNSDPSVDPNIDPRHKSMLDDPMELAADTYDEMNHSQPVQHSSPGGSNDPPQEKIQKTNPVPPQESIPDPASVEVNTKEPPPQPDSSLPMNPDLHRHLEGTVGNTYGEPGIRSSIRVNEEEEELSQDDEEVVAVDDDEGTRIPEDIYIDEHQHHQMYTREENMDEFDDEVMVEEEKGEEPTVNKTSVDWLTQILQNMQPAIATLNESVFLPILDMLPLEFQTAIQQPDFLGIPWIVVLSIEISFLGLVMLLMCCLLCNSRSNTSIQETLFKEVETLAAQKAEVLDALEMTNTQFQKQNLEYFELKSATDHVHRDKSKLEKTCKKVTQAAEEQKGEMEKIRTALKKKAAESEANQKKIKSLDQQMKKSQSDVIELTSKLHDLKGKVYTGEEERSHLSDEIASLEDQNQQLLTSKEMLEEEITGWHERVSELTEQIQLLMAQKKDFEESVTFKDNEIEVLKDCLLQLKGLQSIQKEGPEVDSEAKIQQLMDVTRVNAKLSLVLKERDELQEKLDTEIRAERELESKMGSLEQEIDVIRMEHSKAKSDYNEAQTKLEVLQEYFKSKEVELQRKLGREEALKLQTAEQVSSLSEKAVSAEIDLNNYRQQIADLKSELEKAERNFRTQIAAHEKKSHESWLASRSAERELQESKREAATLRHRLTELEGRRATQENAPLVKPQAAAPSPLRVVSPSFRPGDRSGRPGRRGGPSRNSLIAEHSPSPPYIDPRHRDSPGGLRGRMTPPMMDRDMPQHDDYIPPMRGDMGPSPFGREPLHHPDFGPHGPFPHEDDLGPYGPPPGHPRADFPPDYLPHPDDIDFGPHGPPPPGMDFGPPPRLPPPGRGNFDPHGPPPMDPGFNPRFGPPPPGMDPRERLPPPMPGPGPYRGEGPPPVDRRGPPPHPGMRPGSRTGPLGPPDGPLGPRTSSPMMPGGAPPPQGHSSRGPSSRQPSNMQA